MKICSVVGARPQFVKAAAISRAWRQVSGNFSMVLLHTGQHYDANMSDVFFAELDIPRPDHYLGIGGGSHGQNTGRMIEQIERLLLKEQPDWVLVYGDTNSTLAGALAAVKLHIPTAHAEAGLRSSNRSMPEEINRLLTDHAADLLFTPTATATCNLRKEGVGEDRIRQVGDLMFDAALFFGKLAERRSRIIETLKLTDKRFILATIHRAENTDDPVRLNNILRGFSTSPYPVMWPIHPRTRERLAHFKLALPDTVKTIDPVGYLDMAMLEKQALLIATDSGGVQKEAYFHATPCITLRDETEWVELLETGTNRLVGSDAEKIAEALGECEAYTGRNGFHTPNPYGDGTAADKIVACLTAKSGRL